MRLQRAALKTLNQWKAAPDHKPLLIRGARQTGKTWLVNEFANGQYDNIVSADFMMFFGEDTPALVVGEE